MVCVRVIPVQFAWPGVRGSSRHSEDDWESDVAASEGAEIRAAALDDGILRFLLYICLAWHLGEGAADALGRGGGGPCCLCI